MKIIIKVEGRRREQGRSSGSGTRRIALTGLMVPLCVLGLLGGTAKEVRPMDNTGAAAIVNKYLNVMLIENNHGRGLENLLREDFTFDDPFTKASSAREFMTNPATLRWIDTRKSFRMRRQFVDGDQVCSIYVIDVVTPAGANASFEVADLFELRDGRIAKEKVYFADPVRFAKDMGFLPDYLKQF